MTPRRDCSDRCSIPSRIIVFDGAMGTMLYSKGVVHQPVLRRAEPRAPELVREVHDAVRARRRRGASRRTASAPIALKLAQHGLGRRSRAQSRRRAHRARSRRRPRARRRRRRSARRPHRAVRADEPRRGARDLLASRWTALVEGGVDCFISRRSATSRRSSRRFAPRATSIRHAGHRADDDRRRRPDAVRRDARGRSRAALDALGRRRHRPQLLGRPADDSRGDRADGAGDDAAS